MRTLSKRSSLVALIAMLFSSVFAMRLANPAAANTCTPVNTWYVGPTGNDGNPGNAVLPLLHIQRAIDLAAAGDCVYVRPGNYDETAANVSPASIGGTYNFGLYLGKDNLLVQGVDGSDNPITSAASVAAHVTTNSDANFGPDGVFVEGTGDTINAIAIGKNSLGQNKTIESVGESFTLSNSVIEDYYGSVYLDDFRYDGGTNTPHVKSYTISGNIFRHGVSLDIASGPGGGPNGGPNGGRVITGNTFDGDSNPGPCAGPPDNCVTGEVYWPAVSFNGSGTSIPWFTDPVGQATVTANTFGASDQYIRYRHGLAVATFTNWGSMFTANTFAHGVIDTTNGNANNPRPYSYNNASYPPAPTFPAVERIGGTISKAHASGCGGADCNGELVNAAAGDTLLLTTGTFDEAVNVNKSVTIKGGRAGVDARTRSGAESVLTEGSGKTPLQIGANDVTVDGVTVTGNTSSALSGAGIYITPGHHGTHLVNDIVRTNIVGLFLVNNLQGDPALIQHDLFKDNQNAGPSSGTDIYADNFTAGTGGVNGATIDANSFTNTSFTEDAWALGISNIDTGTRFQHITFSNNAITNHGRGAYFFSTANSSVTGNTFTPSATLNHYGVGIFTNGGGDSNQNIATSTNVLGCGGSCNGTGVLIDDPAATGITVNLNNLAGPPVGINTNTTATVDGTCNWWGSSSGPSGGQAVGSVTTAPWLASSTLTNANCYGGLPAPIISTPSVLNVPEGNSGAHNITVPVTLNHASTNTVTVHFATRSGMAVQPSDYTQTSGTLTFLPGQTSQNVSVSVNGDTTPERYENFFVDLSNPSNATLAGNVAKLTTRVNLQNDDLPTLSAVNANVIVSEGSPVVARFKLNLPYYQPITVNVFTTNGTAVAPGDYTPLPGGYQITFAAGTTGPISVSVTTHTDGVTEPQEQFTITGDPVPAGMANKVVTGIIKQNTT